jgi:hypothetical protein
MEVLPGFERDCFDAVVTDPPWNLEKDYGPHDDAMPGDAHVAWLAAALALAPRRRASSSAARPGWLAGARAVRFSA